MTDPQTAGMDDAELPIRSGCLKFFLIFIAVVIGAVALLIYISIDSPAQIAKKKEIAERVKQLLLRRQLARDERAELSIQILNAKSRGGTAKANVPPSQEQEVPAAQSNKLDDQGTADELKRDELQRELDEIEHELEELQPARKRAKEKKAVPRLRQ